ncbi:alginate export family protein [Emcibacter sp.]|uniref:alginate export family protein n=1 Tax=Emcibacter sp. TaxID=1979954 RepID=UPI003A9448EF
MNINKYNAGLTFLLTATSLAFAAPTMAEETFLDALTKGKPILDANYRFESADDGLRAETGVASTIRIRAGYATGEYEDFSGVIELESTNNFGSDEYDAFPGGNPNGDGPDLATHGVIADPMVSELNQAYLQYTGLEKTTIKAGRQRLILPTARFVGNVGWRQNEQTFDAVSIQTKALADTTVTYAYLFERHNILGISSDMDTHLFDAAYSGLNFGTFTAYAYLLDLAGTADSATYGLRFAGKTKLEDVTIHYKAEYASQSDYADAGDFSADYLAGELGATFSGVTAKVGYELLGSDDGVAAFSTPLATLHKFNGWADRFLTTPANGLEDIYGTVSGAIKGVKLVATYHDFSSDVGGIGYGSEIDLQAVRKFDKFTVGVKFADYSADNAGAGPVNNDVTKVWLWVNFKL